VVVVVVAADATGLPWAVLFDLALAVEEEDEPEAHSWLYFLSQKIPISELPEVEEEAVPQRQ
jgi:hypothetical protein